MSKRTVLIFVALGLAACARSPADREAGVKVHTELVEYRHGDAVLEGFLASPEGTEAGLPGVLVVHAWKGIGDHERDWAEKLAREGFVAFAADIYGKGVRPESNQEAAKLAGLYRGNRGLLRARAAAGLAWLKDHPRVDPDRVGAIGFCFGGGTVLELARSGAEVAGVVSLHGNLDTPNLDDAKSIRGKVLALHGAADPHVPPEQVAAFIAEMDGAGVNWELDQYGGAVHAFSDPAAGDDPSRGAAYDEQAARRAYAATLAFLREVTGTSPR